MRMTNILIFVGIMMLGFWVLGMVEGQARRLRGWRAFVYALCAIPLLFMALGSAYLFLRVNSHVATPNYVHVPSIPSTHVHVPSADVPTVPTPPRAPVTALSQKAGGKRAKRPAVLTAA